MLHQTYCDIRFGFMAVENVPPLSKKEQMGMGRFIETLPSVKGGYIGKVY